MENKFEEDYHKLVIEILGKGKLINTRAGKAKTLFGQNLKIDLTKGFPILTGRRMSYKKARAEFLWMYLGITDTAYLHEHNIYWWDQYATNNDVGKTYGYQIRKWNGHFDQINEVITELDNNSRRAIITFWNPTDKKDQSLPPCYTTMTFVKIGDVLHMDMHLRSSDVAVGLGYDIMIGAMFLNSIAVYANCTPGTLQMSIANAHIYRNNIEDIRQYLIQEIHPMPVVDEQGYLIMYEHGPTIKIEMNT